ncbi:hypothetical protein [Salisaeta longa]|uniref:hypothetical protein n=1 Tax=Salisaeta longa TaxID=503170 RepID=UPI0003B67A56|nr:hypothetical protein [Salisaeta longa]
MHQTYIRTTRWVGSFFALLLLTAAPSSAQEFDLGGFVKAEYLYDTRQVVAARDAEFHLYPAPESDATGTDNLSSFAFFSRLGLGISDLPQALGADITGYVEADFFGASNANVSTFRLRRAFVKMTWENRSVLFGQEWSPLFTLAAFPRTVATTTGVPFQPFARQPQIRYTYRGGSVRFIGIAAWQRDAFQETSDDGLLEQQWAALPMWHGHLQYVQGGTTIGVGGYYKWIRPELTADRFSAGAVQAYATFLGDAAELRIKGTYGGDLGDHLMTGGYVQLQGGGYEPLQTASAWVDIQQPGTVSPGLFAGYLANLGTSKDNVQVVDVAARGASIDYLWRIAPRLALNYGPMRFAFEVEATSALYASGFDSSYAPDAQDTDDAVTNIRGNFSVFLFF